ncbi:MAG: CPBP family intramembrane metalloprotease [Lachnospiraceae bacterium]|nr:CPBP family intramembrane metalloprotease [Lachnospiraceae bacterium]
MHKRFSIVWIVLLLYVVGYFTICVNTEKQDLLWLELSFLSFIVSIVLLAKNHFPKRKYIVISIILTMLFLLSNIFSFNVFTVIQGIILFLSSCASCSVFEKYGKNSLNLIRNTKKTDVVVSILIGIVCGIIWGGINYLLMRGSNPVVPTNVIKALIVSLNPAILEEVAFRCVFFAFCLSMAEGELKNRFQRFTGWCMMIVPHILPHILFSMTNGILESVLSWMISLVLYIVVFGFVFAFWQKKRDVITAMIAHGIVDWIRFCIFGLPI